MDSILAFITSSAFVNTYGLLLLAMVVGNLAYLANLLWPRDY